MVQIFLIRQLWYSHTLKQHRDFGRAFTWVKSFAFSFIFYNKEFRRIYKFITVLLEEGLTHGSVNHGDTDLSTESLKNRSLGKYHVILLFGADS